MTDKEFERILAFLVERDIVRRLLNSDDYQNDTYELPSTRDEGNVQKINLVNLFNWHISNTIIETQRELDETN